MSEAVLEFLKSLAESQLLNALSRRQLCLLYQSVYPNERIPRLEQDAEHWHSTFNDPSLALFLSLMFAQYQSGSVILPHRKNGKRMEHVAQELSNLSAQISGKPLNSTIDFATCLNPILAIPNPYPTWLIQSQSQLQSELPVQPILIQRPEGFSFQKLYLAEMQVRTELQNRLKSIEISDSEIRRAIQTCLTQLSNIRLHSRQAAALALACKNQTAVISGGPGTGKTMVCAQIIKVLSALDPQIHSASIALAAPTGRAAARLQESIQAVLQNSELQDIPSRTLHGLLKYHGATGQFFYNAKQKLPYRLVIVDESSMIDMNLFGHFLSALPHDCRLILLGDRDQLPSVDAGAVLGDLTNAAYQDLQRGTLSKNMHSSISEILSPLGYDPDCSLLSTIPGHLLEDHMIVLTHSHRYGNEIGAIAQAIQQGESDLTHALITKATQAQLSDTTLQSTLQHWFKQHYDQVWLNDCQRSFIHCNSTELIANDHPCFSHAKKLIQSLESSRILCPMKSDPRGVHFINGTLQALMIPLYNEHVGSPILILRNTPGLQIFNGDTGVLVQSSQGLAMLMRQNSSYRLLAYSSIPEHQLAYAMTVHKAQGSEYEHVLLVLPEQDSALLTREILYTAVTRCKTSLHVFGWSNELCSRWLNRTIHRDSGLMD